MPLSVINTADALSKKQISGHCPNAEAAVVDHCPIINGADIRAAPAAKKAEGNRHARRLIGNDDKTKPPFCEESLVVYDQVTHADTGCI